MNLDNKCGNCRHWRRYIDKETMRGNCRALPPVPIQALSANSRGTMSGRLAMIWPTTDLSDLCGLFKHRKSWLYRLINPALSLITEARYFAKSLYRAKR